MNEQTLEQYLEVFNNFLIDTFGYTFLSVLPMICLAFVCVLIVGMLVVLLLLDKRNERLEEKKTAFIETVRLDEEKVRIYQETRQKIRALLVSARETTDEGMSRAMRFQAELLQITIDMDCPGQVDEVPDKVKQGLRNMQTVYDDNGKPIIH